MVFIRNIPVNSSKFYMLKILKKKIIHNIWLMFGYSSFFPCCFIIGYMTKALYISKGYWSGNTFLQDFEKPIKVVFVIQHFKKLNTLNLHLIITKLGIRLAVLKLHIMSVFKPCGLHRSRTTFLQNWVSPTKRQFATKWVECIIQLKYGVSWN